MTPLTPDLVALAVIAAAGSYGDDAVLACIGKQRYLRRALKAAAMGLHAEVGGDLSRFCKVLGLSDKNVYHARRVASAGDPLWTAAGAAALAVRDARGEDAPTDPPYCAAKTVAGPVARDDVAALERSLPLIFARFPGGANSADLAAILKCSTNDAARAAAKLYAGHKCRWVRSRAQGSRLKVLTPWTGSAPVGLAALVSKPPPAAAPAPAAKPKPALGGRISGGLRSIPLTPRAVEPPPIRDRILSVLREAPSSTRSLAILADAKELAVSEALAAMMREGLVEAGPTPPEGARARQWSIARERAA